MAEGRDACSRSVENKRRGEMKDYFSLFCDFLQHGLLGWFQALHY